MTVPDESAKDRPDDLEAVRAVVTALERFEKPERERILRWACEKLGIMPGFIRAPESATAATAVSAPGRQGTSIRQFVADKNPQSDNQFAATVAYYYRFEAPESERKNAITASDLQEACRQAGRPRLGDPGKTLRNAHGVGLLDKGADAGTFRLNTVGENLVAMTLPGGAIDSSATVQRRRSGKSAKGNRRK